MSQQGSGPAGDRPGREVAHRLFATEFDDASVSYTESDEERAPNYVISPTGARLNRLFVVGTLTEVTDVNEEMVRARIVDPTGAFVVYAGQYQPDALAFLERAEPPSFVAVTGKARTFEPEDGDRVYTSIRPESLAVVDADTRDRWVVDTAEHTLDRIATFAAATTLGVESSDLTEALRANGLSDGFAEGIDLALSSYETSPSYLSDLRQVALEAVRVVAGEQSQVTSSTPSPSARRDDEPGYEVFAADGPSLSLPERLRETDTESDAIEEPTASEPDPAAGAAIGTANASAEDSEPSDVDPTVDEASAVDSDEPDDTSREESDDADASEPTESQADEASADEMADTDDLDESNGSDDGTDDLDAFDEGDVDTEQPDDLGDFDADDGMYEFDDEEREAIEEEYGAEFTTGAEVDEPGEAGIDVPDDEPTEEESTDDPAASDANEPATDDSSVDESADSGGDTATDDVDLQERVVDVMDELDDGEGADRTAVVDAVADETGAAAADVEQAIQDALMGGECFEPSEDRLQAI
ncbi:hypothetical protein [Halovivax gelatinilyticus]|uniref:hypothetical protein n=1 Tax=Halovivax gelatinilyticus TaxID=2961597 RepID=UPI0020CA47AD|nr:hypothetical protein [Halovivax gelatinilyticus]